MTTVAEVPIIAAIDVGSNSIKMTVGKVNATGAVDEVGWASEVVRLGQGLTATGKLDESRIEVAIETLKQFRVQAEQLGASAIVAVATEATRAASNGPEFLKRARVESGISIRVLGGEQEAALTFRGLGATSDLTGSVIVADVGGGSTELIGARDGRVEDSTSIPLGSGRLTDRFISNDPPTASELERCEKEASAALEAVTAELAVRGRDETRAIIVGGTGEFMARLVPDPTRIDIAAIRGVLARISALTAADLAQEIEIPEARARVLPAGIAIVAAIVEVLKPNKLEIGRSGVRVGLLLETSENLRVDRHDKNAPDGRANGKLKLRTKGRAPVKPVRTVAEEHDFRETMSALIAERWEAVWKAVPVALEGKDIEGVHDVRVSSRRLRAAMDVAAAAFPKGWYRPLHRAAKEITSTLGEVRDRDVLLEALLAERDKAPQTERPGIERLIARVERERAVARVAMEAYLQGLLDGPIRDEIQRRFTAPGESSTERHGREKGSK